MVYAHEAFHSIFDRALSSHDRVIREEGTQAFALFEVRGAMESLEELFDHAKEFLCDRTLQGCISRIMFNVGNPVLPGQH